MKLTAIAILKSNGAEKTPTILGLAAELSNFGYFQRGPVKEMITFVTRTIVQRTQLGQRQTVKHEDYFCHVHVRESGLAGIVLVDRDYPVTASFSIISKVLDEFQAQEGSKWEAVQADSTVANVILEPAVLKYQVSGVFPPLLFIVLPSLLRPCQPRPPQRSARGLRHFSAASSGCP